MGLIEDLRPGPVAVDTAIFIYLIEQDPRFLGAVKPVFAAIDDGKLKAVTSGVTLLEVLVAPYRAGNAPLAERYEALLTRSRGLRLVDLDRPILRSAALIRAASRLKTPDALQIASALATGCRSFLTNDREIPPVAGLRIVQLRDYVPFA